MNANYNVYPDPPVEKSIGEVLNIPFSISL